MKMENLVFESDVIKNNVLLLTLSQSLFDGDSNQTGIGNTYCGR